jgi:PilZ domain
MAESDVERVLHYRNWAKQTRIKAQGAGNRDQREALLKLAVEFDSLADDAERNDKPRRPERRFSERYRVFKAATIVFNQDSALIACAVRNISRTGAFVTVLSAATVPQEFELRWDSDVHLCIVVRRNADGLGVKFAT